MMMSGQPHLARNCVEPRSWTDRGVDQGTIEAFCETRVGTDSSFQPWTADALDNCPIRVGRYSVLR